MAGFLRGVTVAGLAALLAGCALAERLRDPGEEAAAVAAAGGLAAVRFEAGGPGLAGWSRGLDRPGSLLTVYIEGDGAPWPRRDRPPRDPTPRNPVALRLAAADPSAPLLYLARPCQYLQGAGCEPGLWTDARFSPRVLAIYQAVLDRLQARVPGRRLGLVGWSGGGVVAAMLAASRDDVAWLITVAAPLDLAAWTRHHDLTPLADAPDAAALRDGLAGLAQWHLAGARDAIVPPALVRDFAAALPAPARFRVVEGFDHACCWADDWARWRRLPVDAARSQLCSGSGTC